jgi:hypothetical protein
MQVLIKEQVLLTAAVLASLRDSLTELVENDKLNEKTGAKGQGNGSDHLSDGEITHPNMIQPKES